MRYLLRIFQGNTLLGIGLMCVCFWLPYAQGWFEIIVPARVITRDPMAFLTGFLPFTAIAAVIFVTLLKWLLRNKLLAQRILILLACVICQAVLGTLGVILPNNEISNMLAGKWPTNDPSLSITAVLLYLIVAPACCSLLICSQSRRFILSIFWLGLGCLTFLGGCGISCGYDPLGPRDIKLGLILAILANFLITWGSLGQVLVLRRMEKRQAASDAQALQVVSEQASP